MVACPKPALLGYARAELRFVPGETMHVRPFSNFGCTMWGRGCFPDRKGSGCGWVLSLGLPLIDVLFRTSVSFPLSILVCELSQFSFRFFKWFCLGSSRIFSLISLS